VSTKTKTAPKSPARFAVVGLLFMLPSDLAALGFSWLVPAVGSFKIRDWRDIGKRLLPAVPPRLPVACILIIVVLFTQLGCRNASRDASGITLTLIAQSWVHKDTQRRLNEELALFTKQTGIRVQVLPAPEGAVEQLETWRSLLESGSKTPDVYPIDVIWPGILADNLVDLKDYVPAEEIAAHFPGLIANNTVSGRLVALPYVFSEGSLFYRVDLLWKYGYDTPPKTWEELEAMARRIQAGERAKGNKDFWGFVWQGAPSEVLTCNALEWQVSEGGGTILDENGHVTVNNPQTIRAWSRAASWVGSISPPGVIAYKESDAFNVWQVGNAAFMRSWVTYYNEARAQDSPIRDKFGIAPLPKGRAGVAATLGGDGYGISRYSLHPREAAMLVRFLCGRDEQARRCRTSAEPPTIPALYENADILAANPYFFQLLKLHEGVALRPALPAGKMYPEVSHAYFEAVHAVLTRKQPAAQAAEELQNDLQRMLRTPSARSNADLDEKTAAQR